MTDPTALALPFPATALFQVGDQEPVPWAHLERVNPGLSAEQRATVAALKVGKSASLEHEGVAVKVRRVR